MNGNSRNLDWLAIEQEYVKDTRLTWTAVAAKYNVPESTVRYHAERNQWGRLREQRRRLIEESMQEPPRDTAKRLQELNRKQLQWSEEMRWAINHLLKERRADGSVVLRANVSLNDLYKAALAYAELNRLDRLALGASTEIVQPTTLRDRIDEMSDEEVQAELKRLRAAQVTIN